MEGKERSGTPSRRRMSRRRDRWVGRVRQHGRGQVMQPVVMVSQGLRVSASGRGRTASAGCALVSFPLHSSPCPPLPAPADAMAAFSGATVASSGDRTKIASFPAGGLVGCRR